MTCVECGGTNMVAAACVVWGDLELVFCGWYCVSRYAIRHATVPERHV